MVKIIKPSIGGHDGSSFRELLDMWSERGFCTIEQGPNERSEGYKEDPDSPEAKCWVEEQGNVLLYDFPILDRLKNEYKQCLFSNTYKEGEGNKKWIFWPKHSRVFDELKLDLRQAKKDYQCVFIGTATNRERNEAAPYWLAHCDLWSFNGGVPHVDYLRACASAKFGLCLPGVGPKCLRDVEYMGLGVVPIVMNEDAVRFYANPPVEGEHYFYVKDAEEMVEAINSSPEKTKQMSEACIEWFEENCSVDGSFKTTMEIIND